MAELCLLNLWEGMAGESNHIPVGSVECQYLIYSNLPKWMFQAGAAPLSGVLSGVSQ